MPRPLAELKAMLDGFRALPAETEWVEFKEAKTTYDFEKIGQYFSALSYEANLQGHACGWLIFGIHDKVPRPIVGTTYTIGPTHASRSSRTMMNLC